MHVENDASGRRRESQSQVSVPLWESAMVPHYWSSKSQVGALPVRRRLPFRGLWSRSWTAAQRISLAECRLILLHQEPCPHKSNPAPFFAVHALLPAR